MLENRIVTHPRPDWFCGLWTEALQCAQTNHTFIESALGIGRMIDEGNLEEARRVYEESLLPALIQKRLGLVTQAETNSTQIRGMISSGIYPPDLCLELQKIFGEHSPPSQ